MNYHSREACRFRYITPRRFNLGRDNCGQQKQRVSDPCQAIGCGGIRTCSDLEDPIEPRTAAIQCRFQV